ncbi:glutathione S-transferase [Arenimonas soli]|uniref:Glutathione S-transferase n=1 Tax=Arenimonas soli TaxID=2269504 RepID=A0ABQ1HBF5_9GAMM|nr:glutathione S-transferase family protein [Arenimonas soli]GGA69311.1 glutathione S-transferase [Arenimonas soli]
MSTTLVIGNKNYSSWSLRPWLLLRQAGVAFEEVRLPLDTPEFQARIGDWSPTGRVPVLHDHGQVVWDSLAICEYANERWLRGSGWPGDPGRRALARSVACEMHSGFPALRAQLPMNCRREPRERHWDQAAQRDIDRVQSLWSELRGQAGGGDFLFGRFGIADAMFAPVCVRFRGYGVPLAGAAADYVEAIYALPAMSEWLMAGRAESERVAHDEA